jgi:HD-GYP domain-containing protein (c-di-GMP phosphodiesterase class II)
VPEYLYNHGELYNLKITRGTLTAEDRYKINEHIMETIVMLEELPFPKNLSRVAEYAGTHHEKMDGTGYPRKLNGTQLSVPARIMVIADIFEALTASDRPYKDAKTLSESIAILADLKDKNHIDGDLFELFLRAGLHVKFGERFLKPEQIDYVDIEQYIGTHA